MTKLISILFAVVLFTVSFASADVYPHTAVVIEIDYDNDIVVVEDGCFFTWKFFGCEDFAIGDVVSLLMDDVGTNYILDDVIVSAVFSGFTADIIVDTID